MPIFHEYILNTFAFLLQETGVEWVKSLVLKPLDRPMLNNHIEHIESLNQQIKRPDEEIRVKASEDEDVKLLLSMTGVDIYTALLIKSEIGSIYRFPEYKKLVSWAGLVPYRCINQGASVITAE